MDDEDSVTDIAVIHMGSSYIQYALTGALNQPHIERSVVGSTSTPLPGLASSYVGDSAWSKREILRNKFPVYNGSIKPGESETWSTLFQHAYTSCERYVDEPPPLMMTEAIDVNQSDWETMVQVAMETLKVPLFASLQSPSLALHQFSVSSGVVVDFGLNRTSVVAIENGQLMRDTISQMPLGGAHMTQYLQKLVSADGWSLTGSQTVNELINSIKEQMCYVAPDYQALLSTANADPEGFLKQDWISPQGQRLPIGKPLFCAPELLFEPSLDSGEQVGLIDRLVSAISKELLLPGPCEVVLTGGAASMAGMVYRVQLELDKRLGTTTTNVRGSNLASWQGAFRFASNRPSFESIAISSSQYDEEGLSSQRLRDMRTFRLK